MHNTISMYDKDIDSYGFNPFWLPFPPAAIGAFVGFIGMLPPFSGMWTVYLLVACVLVTVLNIAGYLTHINRTLSTNQELLRRTYLNLPDEIAKAAPLTLEQILSLNDNEASDLQCDYNTAHKQHNLLAEEQRRSSGVIAVNKQILKEITTAAEEEVKRERTIQRQMKELA